MIGARKIKLLQEGNSVNLNWMMPEVTVLLHFLNAVSVQIE